MENRVTCTNGECEIKGLFGLEGPQEERRNVDTSWLAPLVRVWREPQAALRHTCTDSCRFAAADAFMAPSSSGSEEPAWLPRLWHYIIVIISIVNDDSAAHRVRKELK